MRGQKHGQKGYGNSPPGGFQKNGGGSPPGMRSPARFDGPGDSDSGRGRSPGNSQAGASNQGRNQSQGSGHGSRQGRLSVSSKEGGSNRPANPFGAGLGYDPAKSEQKQSKITNSRVELPAIAYSLDDSVSSLPLF